MACIVLATKLMFDLFMKTKFGFLIKVTGDNPTLVHTLGVSTGMTKICALMISNALVALAGSLMAQYQGFSDITMGNGIIVMGLASVIFGEALCKRFKFFKGSTIVIVGAWLYQIVTTIVLQCGFAPSDLKLMSALIIIAALTFSTQKLNTKNKRKVKLFQKVQLRGCTNVSNSKSM
ncbi:MAG TPA: hypothetical protein DCY20_11190 [Firmicutes bacterium]|nr:hypothetical protein [Bacillota bacterium]